MNTAYEELSLKHLLKSCIRKFKYFVISFLIAVCAIAGFVALKGYIMPEYYTNSVVMIYPKETSSEAENYVADGKLSPQDFAALKGAVGSYINLVENRWVIYKALDNLGIELEDTEGFIENGVAVTNIGESLYLNIEIKFKDAQTAYRINQEIVRILPEVLEDLNIGANLAVVSYPVMPTMPDMPSFALLAAVGVGAWLLLGFLFVLLYEVLNATIRTDEDIKRVMDIESVGYLPSVRSSARAKRLFENAVKRVAAYFILTKSRVVAIAAIENEENANLAAYGLAQQLEALGYNILFVDFQEMIMKRKRRNNHELSDNKGIQYVNFYESNPLLKPGSVASRVRELLDSSGNTVDFVLLNTPSLSSMYYSVECYNMADTALLMARHAVTKQETAKRRLHLLKKSAIKKYGCIMYDIHCSGLLNYYRDFMD